MRNVVRLGLLAGVVSLLAATPGAQARTDRFSLIIERDGATWSVECPAGCQLNGAKVTTSNVGMPMRVDNFGLRTTISPHPTDTTFAFTLTPQGHGWIAESVNGTRWAQLSMNCDFRPCRARVTDSGVTGAPGRR